MSESHSLQDLEGGDWGEEDQEKFEQEVKKQDLAEKMDRFDERIEEETSAMHEAEKKAVDLGAQVVIPAYGTVRDAQELAEVIGEAKEHGENLRRLYQEKEQLKNKIDETES